MHDLLRDLAIRKAKDENFFTAFSKEEDVNNLATIKPRRVALQFCTPTEDDIYSENTRSLLCFGKRSSNDSGFGLLNYSGFGLLRVLTLESVDMTTFTRRQWPKGMIHMRYLRLRNCNIPQGMFKEISFYDLEIIDLSGSEVHKKGNETLDLCDVVNPSSGSWFFYLKLHHQRLAKEMPEFCDVVFPSLRHVSGSWSFRLPLKWDKHTNLQTIMNVQIQIESVIVLGFCINLCTLVIRVESVRDSEKVIKGWQNLKSVLGRTEQLLYLSIETYGLLPFGGTKDLPCHEKIQKLVLNGEWERNICVPSVEMFPTNLTKLKLKSTKLQEDPMPILERLQSLRILYLYGQSFMGTELICSTGGFPNLEKLKLRCLNNLHHWDIKEGAMHILRYLDIYTYDKLHVLPELQNVQTLQELTVYKPSRELWEGMQMQGKDVHKIKHIPSVHIRGSSSSSKRPQETMQE